MYGGGEAGLPVVELARGGRYDNAGAVFGRPRAAVGFSLDIKELTRVADVRPLRPAILAPWGEDSGLRRAIGYLRAKGETVVCVPSGNSHEVHEFQCDRHLVAIDGQWVVEARVLS
jgi:ATP phosphoribosyltransferase regulatory subunit